MEPDAVDAMGKALVELAWATLMIRTSGPKAGEIHHKPCFVGSEPQISEESMVLIREALRPGNKP